MRTDRLGRAALAALALAAPAAAVAAQPGPTVSIRTVGLFTEHLYDGKLSGPQGVFAHAGTREYYVADTRNDLVGVFDALGNPVFAFGGPGVLNQPQRVVVERAGRIYVLDADRDRLKVFSYRGARLPDLKLPGLTDRKGIALCALAIDADDNLYLAENQLQEVFVYDAERRMVTRFGSRGDGPGQFSAIGGLAVDAERIFVLDQPGTAIQVFDHKGHFVRGWGEHDMGPEAFSLPESIAVDDRGRLFIADALRHEVKFFEAEGRFMGHSGDYGTSAGQFGYPAGVAIDWAGRLAVVEKANGRVQIFEVQEHQPAPRQP